MFTPDNTCTCCGKKLNPKTMAWLELDQDTNLYHDPEKGIPKGHTSQGGFPFGSACARKVLRNGGNVD